MKLPDPFKSLPNKREVWAWGMFDFANQSFTLLIITLLFSRYVQQVATPEPADAGRDQVGLWNWALMHGGSLLLVVVLSPLVGALADARGWRKQALMLTGCGCAALTAALALVGADAIVLAALLYIPANICYQIGENLLASLLPHVATPRTIGRVSAIGWTMGYVGALGLLVCVALGMVVFDLPDEAQWRPFFVFAGVWFALGILPAGLILRDDPPDAGAAHRGVLRESVSRVVDTARHARHYRHLVRFLVAFFVYGFGVQVIIGFASIIAKQFGFGQTQLVLFVAQITITAGIASALTSRFQDRIGAKPTIIVYLSVWIASAAGLVATKLIWPDGGPQWPLWIVGNGLGLALGGIGTSSRSMVARFAPRHRTAEFFGLWGMTYKLAGAIGVLGFGAVARLAGDLASLVLLASFFVVGLLLIFRVGEAAGVRAARRAEREHDRVV